MYLTLHPNVMTMTEAVVHEFQHNKFNVASDSVEYLENAFHPLYQSPIRPDPRPLWGILLAVHAFLPVAELYRRMRDAGHPFAARPDFERAHVGDRPEEPRGHGDAARPRAVHRRRASPCSASSRRSSGATSRSGQRAVYRTSRPRCTWRDVRMVIGPPPGGGRYARTAAEAGGGRALAQDLDERLDHGLDAAVTVRIRRAELDADRRPLPARADRESHLDARRRRVRAPPARRWPRSASGAARRASRERRSSASTRFASSVTRWRPRSSIGSLAA